MRCPCCNGSGFVIVEGQRMDCGYCEGSGEVEDPQEEEEDD